jgi:hypothetical protein
MSEEGLSDLQRAINEQGHTWRAGETSLSALPPEEQQYRLGLTLVPDEMDRIREAIRTRAPMAVEFPPDCQQTFLKRICSSVAAVTAATKVGGPAMR